MRNFSVWVIAYDPKTITMLCLIHRSDQLASSHGQSGLKGAGRWAWRGQVVFGGTNIKTDIARAHQKTPTFLIATPGAL